MKKQETRKIQIDRYTGVCAPCISCEFKYIDRDDNRNTEETSTAYIIVLLHT